MESKSSSGVLGKKVGMQDHQVYAGGVAAGGHPSSVRLEETDVLIDFLFVALGVSYSSDIDSSANQISGAPGCCSWPRIL